MGVQWGALRPWGKNWGALRAMGGNGGAVRILKAIGGMGEDWEDGGKGRALTLRGEDLQDHGGTSEGGQPGGTMRDPGDSPDPPCSLRAFGKWHLQRGGGGEDHFGPGPRQLLREERCGRTLVEPGHSVVRLEEMSWEVHQELSSVGNEDLVCLCLSGWSWAAQGLPRAPATAAPPCPWVLPPQGVLHSLLLLGPRGPSDTAACSPVPTSPISQCPSPKGSQ